MALTRPSSLPATRPAPETGVHPVYVRMLQVLLRQSAVDGDEVLAQAGLDAETLRQDDLRLPPATVLRLVPAALAATGKPWLGLELGHAAPVSAHGAPGHAAITAPDLGRCLQALARFGLLRVEGLAWYWQAGRTEARLEVQASTDWGPARAVVLDTVAAALLRLVEAALGQLPAGLGMDMPGPAPSWRAQYQRLAPVDWRFDQAELALRVPTALLTLPCLSADARAHAEACLACESALSARADRALAPQIRHWLASLPAGDTPRLVDAAHACGLGPRTLMRRLQAEGASFQGLLDAHRQAQTLRLLRETRLSVEDIATQLGYADPSNFSRTVRRWFGQAPSALRG